MLNVIKMQQFQQQKINFHRFWKKLIQLKKKFKYNNPDNSH